jgi:hypothetical protein
MASVKRDVGPEDLIELADKTGVAISSVKDGYVMVFTKKHIEGILQQLVSSGQEKCIVLVRQPKFEN